MPEDRDGTTSEVTLDEAFVPYEIEVPSSGSLSGGRRRCARPVLIVAVLALITIGAVVAIAVAVTRPKNETSSAAAMPEGTVPLTILIQLDEKPQETGWALACQSQPVTSVRAGSYTQQNAQIQVLVNVLEGEICVLSVVDTGGDGIKNGYFEVYFGDFTGRLSRRVLREFPEPILFISGDFLVETQGIFTASDPASSTQIPTTGNPQTQPPTPDAGSPTVAPTSPSQVTAMPTPTPPLVTLNPTENVPIGDPTGPTPPPSPSTPSPTPQGPVETPPPQDTPDPTRNPTQTPTRNPTRPPTLPPSVNPTRKPTETPTGNPTRNPTPVPGLPATEVKFENSYSGLCLNYDDYEPFNFQFDVETQYSLRTDRSCSSDDRTIWRFLADDIFEDSGVLQIEMDGGSYRCLAVASPGRDQIAYPLDLLPCDESDDLFRWKLEEIPEDDELYQVVNQEFELCMDYCKSCSENNVWVRRCEADNEDQNFAVLITS